MPTTVEVSPDLVTVEVSPSPPITVEIGTFSMMASGTGWPFDVYSSELESVVASSGSALTTLVITSPQTLGASLSIPANVSIEIKNGGVITVPTGMTLTIAGSFAAGLYQCFDGPGSIAFGQIEAVLPEWFKSPDATEDTDSILAAVATGKSVHFAARTYTCNQTIPLIFSGQSLIGAGRNKSDAPGQTLIIRSTETLLDAMVKIGPDKATPTTDRTVNQTHANTIRGISFQGSVAYIPATKDTRFGIFVNNAVGYQITGCNLIGFFGAINIRGTGKASTNSGNYENFYGSITENVIEYCEEFGIAAGCGCSQTLFQHNLIECIGPTAIDTNRTAYGIRLVSSGIGNVVRDNMIQVIGYPSYGNSSTNKTAHGIGIWFNAQTSLLIEGNYSESCETSVYAAQGYNVFGSTVDDLLYPYPPVGRVDGQDQNGNQNINIIGNFYSGLQPLAIYLSYIRGVTLQGNNFGYYPITAEGELWDNPDWGTVGTGYASWPMTGQGILSKGDAVIELNMYGNTLFTGAVANSCAELDPTMGGRIQLDPAFHSEEVDGVTDSLFVTTNLDVINSKKFRIKSSTGAVVHEIVAGGTSAGTAAPNDGAYIAKTYGGYTEGGLFKHAVAGAPVIREFYDGESKIWSFDYADGAGKVPGSQAIFGSRIYYDFSVSPPTIKIGTDTLVPESYLVPQSGTAAANTITPRRIGDEYLLTSGPTFYKATGLTSADWINISGVDGGTL